MVIPVVFGQSGGLVVRCVPRTPKLCSKRGYVAVVFVSMLCGVECTEPNCKPRQHARIPSGDRGHGDDDERSIGTSFQKVMLNRHTNDYAAQHKRRS